MTNDFSMIADDEIGNLTRVELGEVYSEQKENMNKEAYKAESRARRMAKPNNKGAILEAAAKNASEMVYQIRNGTLVPTFNNSEAWAMQRLIAMEIAPIIRANQKAWENAHPTV